MRALPETIQAAISGYDWDRVTLGESGAAVFGLRCPQRVALFLKHASGVLAAELREEATRLRWLAGRVSVPQVIAETYTEDRAWLVITALPGRDAAQASRAEVAKLVAPFARALRALHESPTVACPFDQRLEVKIAEAGQRTQLGLVDESDFDGERIGRSAIELLKDLEHACPAHEDIVLTHGDACLPNAIFDGTSFSGFVDCARAGLSDRYRDLALADRSIRLGWGPQWVQPFFEAYGLPAPDRHLIAYYQLLDEFF